MASRSGARRCWLSMLARKRDGRSDQWALATVESLTASGTIEVSGLLQRQRLSPLMAVAKLRGSNLSNCFSRAASSMFPRSLALLTLDCNLHLRSSFRLRIGFVRHACLCQHGRIVLLRSSPPALWPHVAADQRTIWDGPGDSNCPDSGWEWHAHGAVCCWHWRHVH